MWREKVEMPEAGIGARPVDDGPDALSTRWAFFMIGMRVTAARAANAAGGIKD